MALATIQAALDQYNANLSWQSSRASAELALEAIRFLLANRAQESADQGSSMKFEAMTEEKKALEKFLGVGAPRAFGRSRTLKARFSDTGVA